YDNTASVCGQYSCGVSCGRHIVWPGVLGEEAVSHLDQRRNHQAHDEFTVGERIENYGRRTGSKAHDHLADGDAYQAGIPQRKDAGGDLADSAKEIMEDKEDYYAIGVTGIPKDLARQLTEGWLKIPGKPDIQPAKGDFQDRGRAVDLMILFPRKSPITLDDKE